VRYRSQCPCGTLSGGLVVSRAPELAKQGMLIFTHPLSSAKFLRTLGADVNVGILYASIEKVEVQQGIMYAVNTDLRAIC
jgi:hypothetical protein